MASKQIQCPECRKTLKLATALPPGKRFRCPECQAVIMVPSAKSHAVSAVRKERPLQGGFINDKYSVVFTQDRMACVPAGADNRLSFWINQDSPLLLHKLK